MSTHPTRTVLAAVSGLLFTIAQASADGLEAVNSSATSVADQERFYVVFFAYQSADNEIKSSHTFAAFLRTTGGSSYLKVAETATISWLPASGKISLGRFAEPGVNQSLEATLASAEERHLQITLTGPFEIQRELFQRAVRQSARLNRGEFEYKLFDGNARNTAKNCIHALADMFTDDGLLSSGTMRGQEATLLVVHHFAPFYVSGRIATEAKPLLEALQVSRFATPTESLVATGGSPR